MSETIRVEPADEHRQAFARWCLAQDPPILTATANASDVPTHLFGSVPDELLDGAYIDGHVFRPVLEAFEPDGDGYRSEDDPGASDEQAESDERPELPRRRRSSRKDTNA